MTHRRVAPSARHHPYPGLVPFRPLLGAAAAVLASGILAGALHGQAAPAPPAGAPNVIYPKATAEMEPRARSDPLEFLRTALRWHDERVIGYTCQFSKQENIAGELRKPETMRMKFRVKPFSIYVKWVGEISKDQEVIYVEGQNAGKAVANPAGILGVLTLHRISLDPLGKLALKHSRRPLTMAGMGNMLRLIIPQCERARANGDLTLTYEGIREESGRPAYVFKRVLPNKSEYPCSVLTIYIDTQYLLCVRTDAFDWGGNLVSQYCYSDLTLNPSLGDDDFNPGNRNYGFRKF